MGDPRKTRSKYQGPRHPWNKERIASERSLVYEYGLANKKELWKVESKLKKYKNNVKRLIAQTGAQAEKELQQLFSKLKRYGIISADATADDVLGLETKQLLDRRLQTLVLKHELAHSAKQARQFITHGHIVVAGKKMTVPGYLVPLAEESTIQFHEKSSLARPDHPERIVQQQSTGAGNKDEQKTEKEKAAEPEPVVQTSTTKQSDEPIEQQIEEETDNAGEIAEAVEEAEADKIVADHEEAVQEAAVEEKKDEKKKDDEEEKALDNTEDKKEGDAA